MSFDIKPCLSSPWQLGAFNSGEIRLGAQKSNGFGRLTLCVRKRSYDLMNEADRAAWIQVDASIGGEFGRVMGWADKYRRLGVRTNADNPHVARLADRRSTVPSVRQLAL